MLVLEPLENPSRFYSVRFGGAARSWKARSESRDATFQKPEQVKFYKTSLRMASLEALLSRIRFIWLNDANPVVRELVMSAWQLELGHMTRRAV